MRNLARKLLSCQRKPPRRARRPPSKLSKARLWRRRLLWLALSIVRTLNGKPIKRLMLRQKRRAFLWLPLKPRKWQMKNQMPL